MSKVKNIVILGCTGSIGQQTIDVIDKHPDKLKLAGAFCNSSSTISKIASDHNLPEKKWAHATDSDYIEKIKEVISDPSVDVVVNSMSGAVGARASVFTLQQDKTLALANKESLVVCGDIIMPLAREKSKKFKHMKLLPIDSEHGAIFQCLYGENIANVKKLWVTASGGPFRGKTRDELKNITKEQALQHPSWHMGPKITIDSATLMNKGLEVIEAHQLFGLDYDDIKVVVQPQSVIHSMVEYIDGSVKAHLGTTDMRIPIQYTLSFPERWDSPVEALDFTQLKSLDFAAPDFETFKCLKLAYQVGKTGGTLPCIMNAANEVAVNEFLNDRTKFLNIGDSVERIIDLAQEENMIEKVENIEQLSDIDTWARKNVLQFL